MMDEPRTSPYRRTAKALRQKNTTRQKETQMASDVSGSL